MFTLYKAGVLDLTIWSMLLEMWFWVIPSSEHPPFVVKPWCQNFKNQQKAVGLAQTGRYFFMAVRLFPI
jgi:hypothetical protein